MGSNEDDSIEGREREEKKKDLLISFYANHIQIKANNNKHKYNYNNNQNILIMANHQSLLDERPPDLFI